jgi:hypothetical protein
MNSHEFSFHKEEGKSGRITVRRMYIPGAITDPQLHYIDLDKPFCADALVINTEHTRPEFGIAVSFDSIGDKWAISRIMPGEAGIPRLIKVFEMPV